MANYGRDSCWYFCLKWEYPDKNSLSLCVLLVLLVVIPCLAGCYLAAITLACTDLPTSLRYYTFNQLSCLQSSLYGFPISAVYSSFVATRRDHVALATVVTAIVTCGHRTGQVEETPCAAQWKIWLVWAEARAGVGGWLMYGAVGQPDLATWPGFSGFPPRLPTGSLLIFRCTDYL